jgi:hypothetical protein
MPIIVWFLIFAAAAIAAHVICPASVIFRGVLIAGALLGAGAGERWAFQRYGFCRIPNIIYLLIPAGVILACVLIYLAFTSVRGFLMFCSVIAGLATAGWVLGSLTPFAGLLLVIWVISRCLRQNPYGGSLFKAFVVHSAVPDVSVGEAYMASEADLI